MDQEQINTLARMYAESVNPIEFYSDDIVERNMDVMIERDSAFPVLQWLSERYCIVEKSKVMEEYDFNYQAAISEAIRTGDMKNKYVIQRDLIEILFPELFKDKEQ